MVYIINKTPILLVDSYRCHPSEFFVQLVPPELAEVKLFWWHCFPEDRQAFSFA